MMLGSHPILGSRPTPRGGGRHASFEFLLKICVIMRNVVAAIIEDSYLTNDPDVIPRKSHSHLLYDRLLASQ